MIGSVFFTRLVAQLGKVNADPVSRERERLFDRARPNFLY